MNISYFTRPVTIIFGNAGMFLPFFKRTGEPLIHTKRIPPAVFRGMEKNRKMHSCMEKEIKGVHYRVYSSYDGDADFRELYERCLASRLLGIHGQRCAGDAADG